nr:JmjC domain-containing protein [Tanacetum cinerariifolium]
ILEAERQELLEQELKQSLDAEQVYLDSLLVQRVVEEQERESRASAAQSTQRQAELDRVALNILNEEWIGLVDQVQTNPTLFAELLGADVSKDTFSVRMVELMNQQWKVIAKMKAKAKRDKPMTPAQQKEFMRTFVKKEFSHIYYRMDLEGCETLESSDSKKLKSSHSTTQSVELQEPTSVSAGDPILAVTPIPAVTSIPVVTSVPGGSSIFVVTPSAAGVSTTAGASGSASDASKQDATFRKPSRKKSIARSRSLPRAYKPKSDALLFDEDDPEAEFKKYLRQASDDDEPAELVSLALVFDITSWEIIPTEFGLVLDKYKTERATGIGLGLWIDLRTLITTREERDPSIIWDDQDQWQIRSWRFYALLAIHILETEAGDILYMFVDKKYLLTPETIQRMLNHGLEIDRDPSGNDLTTAIQLIQSLLNQLNPAA